MPTGVYERPLPRFTRKEIQARYRAKHRDEIKQKAVAYRQSHKSESSDLLHAEAVRKWRNQNPERAKTIKQRAYAKNRNRILIEKRMKYYKNREENLRKHDEYRRKNLWRFALYSRMRIAWKKASSGSHSMQDVIHRLEQQIGKCFWCVRILDGFHVDHVIPLSRGGSNGHDNIVLACPSCNVRKRNMMPEQWMRRMLVA